LPTGQVLIEHPAGIPYYQLSPAHQQQLLQLIGFTFTGTTVPLRLCQKRNTGGGLDVFLGLAGWLYNPRAGRKPLLLTVSGVLSLIIVEYDNSQNNANHIHTVIRDLTNDFMAIFAAALQGGAWDGR
jgi:hypothetical protein